MMAASVVLTTGFLTAGCASTVPVTADSLAFHANVSWQREIPQHDSRRLQFRVRSNYPELEDAKIVVWNFDTMRDSGDGLTIKANIERWTNQFVQDDGSPSDGQAQELEYLINDMPVHVVDISGRYVAETSPGSGVSVNRPGYRMLGAYIQAPQGDYVVKFWGPAPVVTDNIKAFRTFVWSAKAGAPAWPTDIESDPAQPKNVLTAAKTLP